MSLIQTTNLIQDSAADAMAAQEAGSAIAGFAKGDRTLQVTFARATGERLETTLPASALTVLAQVLGDMAQGKTVTVVPHRAELTTHQAADLLHVSRPFLIKLLDQGAIEHRKVGRHRRIRYEDVQAYLEREKAARRETLAALAAYDQEIGLDAFDAA